jgi:ribokinase
LLSAEGISAAGVRSVDQPTGTAVVIVDANGENTIVVAALANSALAGLTTEDEALLDSCAVLLCQLEIPLGTVAAALRRAQGAGARTVLNAAPAVALPAEMTGSIDVLIVNEGEARTVAAAMSCAGGSDVDRLLTVAPEVVVTRGREGADYANRGGDSTHVAAPRVQAVDSTGAGDAFCGAFCAALAAGEPTVDALKVAVAAGAWSVQHRGTIESIPYAADLAAGPVVSTR